MQAAFVGMAIAPTPTLIAYPLLVTPFVFKSGLMYPAVLPLGATMNMNGTALFEGVTVVFLAQLFLAEPLSLGQQALVVVLSVLTAIGAAGVPGGSIPLLVLVLGSVGVPAEGLAVILGVDRFLDMCRTTLNVVGDIAAATFVARTEGYKLLHEQQQS